MAEMIGTHTSMDIPYRDNCSDIMNVLKRGNVNWFNHFTDERNIDSIRRSGGLFSWQYCIDNNIHIACPGGDPSSQKYDLCYCNQDNIHLSFCNIHPMTRRLINKGYNLVLLKISTDVALFNDTQFSNMNAVDHLHQQGFGLEYLLKVNFLVTKLPGKNCFGMDQKYHQAEVLVRRFIPAKYILNLNNPDSISVNYFN